jgi:hypothetical protein
VNDEGNSDNHFLRKLKRIGFKAGLNCGQCQSGAARLLTTFRTLSADWVICSTSRAGWGMTASRFLRSTTSSCPRSIDRRC